MHKSRLFAVFATLCVFTAPAFSQTWEIPETPGTPSLSDGAMPYYHYQLTDIAKVGLTSKQLFSEVRNDWMELKHSVCSNRAHIWGYDMYRHHNINVGRIFIFFTADVWKGEKKGYMYHAGTYVIENGQEWVLERSYNEVFRPLTIVEWMDNEMEGKAPASQCIEITEKDTDLTEYFYERYNLPRKREGGKPSAPCYFRKVPGYLPYPASVAEIDFKKDADGKPSTYNPTDFDFNEVMTACIDSRVGHKKLRQIGAADFCRSYLRR